MAFTTFRTWVADDVLQAAQLNIDVRNNGQYFKGQDGAIVWEDNASVEKVAAAVDLTIHANQAAAIAALKFKVNGTDEAYWRYNPATNDMELYDPGAGAVRWRIDMTTGVGAYVGSTIFQLKGKLSTYAGNSSGASRQIAVGLRCLFVYIHETLQNQSFSISDSFEGIQHHNTGHAVFTALALHGSDGFYVGGGSNIANVTGSTYNYTAYGY